MTTPPNLPEKNFLDSDEDDDIFRSTIGTKQKLDIKDDASDLFEGQHVEEEVNLSEISEGQGSGFRDDAKQEEDVFGSRKTQPRLSNTPPPLFDGDDAALPAEVARLPPSAGISQAPSTPPATLDVSGAAVLTRPLPQSIVKTRSHEELGEEVNSGPKVLVKISEFEKRGDGMNSYMVYRINTVTEGVPGFSKSEYEAWRRFSDFLNLHQKLVTKHMHNGRIVPSVPEKDVVGMAKSKMSKDLEEDHETAQFLERRRAALQRFMQRLAEHPTLSQDPDFREFITFDGEFPKATNTSAISSHNVTKWFGKTLDSFSRITFKMDESDQWFEEKHNEIENLDEQLRKLHASVEQMLHLRRELSGSIDSYCRSMQLLAACEDNTALSRAFSQLVDAEERVGQAQQEQADKDLLVLAELLKDYVGIVHAVKGVLHERHKVWQGLQAAQLALNKRRQAKTQHELAGRADKLPQARRDVDEAEARVHELEEQFEAISQMIRKEWKRFDSQRIREFKSTLLGYLDCLAHTQQQVSKYWESYVPEAKAIST